MIPNEDKPTWLTIMENGSVGEARTKALLLDRFWVLERSVDIEGADFIVQRRQSTYRLDSGKALLGLVQAKFLQDTATTIYVNPDYVCDEETQARDAFFLIAHTGIDDNQQIYFLDARQIIKDFIPVPAESKTNALKYRLPGTQVLADKYKLTRSQVLLNIEKALGKADRAKNTTFFSPYIPGLQAESKPLELNQKNFPCHDDSERVRHEELSNTLNALKRGTPNLVEKIKHLLALARTLKDTLDPIEAADAVSELAFETALLSDEKFFKHPAIANDEDFNLIREAYTLVFLNRYHAQQKWGNWLAAKQEFITTVAQRLLSSSGGTGVGAVHVKVAFKNDAQIDSIVAEPALNRELYRNEGKIDCEARTISIEAPLRNTPYDEAASITFATDLAQLFEEKFAQLNLWTYKYNHPDGWLGS